MRSIVHLLSYVSKCTVTDSPLNTQANSSKCPPSACIHFLTRVTRELVNLRSSLVANCWVRTFSRKV